MAGEPSACRQGESASPNLSTPSEGSLLRLPSQASDRRQLCQRRTMRRRVYGEWQYRRPTAEEEGEEWSARQY